MELHMMFVGSEDMLNRCRQPRSELMTSVSSIVGQKSYGPVLEFIGVNVVFQDTGIMELKRRLSRKRKEFCIDVELSRQWVEAASGVEIKLALLGCLIEAIRAAGQCLKDEQHSFASEDVIADLQTLLDEFSETTQ